VVPERVLEMRRKHGLSGPERGSGVKRSTREWRNKVLSGSTLPDNGVAIPAQSDTWPKNGPILDALKVKFAMLGFDWTTGSRTDTKGRRGRPLEHPIERRWVDIQNMPTVGGHGLNLADALLIEPELVDGWQEAEAAGPHVRRVNQPAGDKVEAARVRMNKTGIGYKGLSGVSWRQLIDPFTLPTYFLDKLGELGQALALAFKAIHALHKSNPGVQHILNHGRPDRIPALMQGGPVMLMRPDIVVVKDPVTGVLRPVITEFESCPAGQGMSHAMELGYGLDTTMLDGYVRLLDGRKLIVFATNEWAEYVWDQAVFVAALRERGLDAEIWFDTPLQQIHDAVRQRGGPSKLTRKGWWPHDNMSDAAKATWNSDFLGRLKALGFDEFVHGSDEGFPQTLGPNTVVFRFGYFDNFVNTGGLDQLVAWDSQDTFMMNPLWHCLENKALMAALWHPNVMHWIKSRDPAALTTLHNCVAETRLLDRVLPQVRDERHLWLTKFGAWDGDNKSWGARSLSLGSQAQNQMKWEKELAVRARLPHPVVAQHIIASHRYTVAYRDSDGNVRLDRGARTRLTPFFLFSGDAETDGHVDLVGSTMTLRTGSFRIHGADDAEEGPVIYQGE